MAIAMLLFFKKYVHVPTTLERIVTRISPLMFGVYVIHEGTGEIGRLLYTLPEAWLAAHTQLHPMGIVFICAALTFAACVALDYVRHLVVAPLKRMAVPYINKIDERWGFR